MTYRVGDVVYSQAATPSVVIGRDEANGKLKCDKDFNAFQVKTRHGLINGMNPETRDQFNQIMDEISLNKDDSERVDLLLNKVEELQVDPKNFRLVQYLDGQVRHLMNVRGVKPRFFTTEEHKVR